MADSKKYNGSTWEHSLRKLTTATDTITTLPVDVYADGNNATAGLRGNTVQSGTPTPDNPIMPQGCGNLETVGAKAGQYKIPISSANTTTLVYLGEVQTTRKVKKLVLTGEENWIYRQGVPSSVFFLEMIDLNVVDNHGLCTHYLNQDSGGFDVLQDKHVLIKLSSTGTKWFLAVRDTDFGLPSFKAYLAQQYAAGTPVTVYYVLETPETGIVNEPLMKIGDYADTVSGITVPTITGKDTFDVETTLKPSEVSLSYTGWHDASVEEWDGSQWNE